jgi:protein-S-isoprenylcysteine O-methyltransferase Ste14
MERMREVATRRNTVEGRREETVTLKLFIVCGLMMVFGGIAEYVLRDLRVFWPTFAVGLVISIGAFVLRRAAIRALGQFWSLHVEMRERHEFVRTGPFKRVRHPAYLSMILEHVGMMLVLGAYYTFAVVMAVFIPTLRARLRREEVALVRQLGPAYEEYRRATPALLPF